MPGFPTNTVGTPTNRGKARRYANSGLGDFAGGFFEEFVDEGLVGLGVLVIVPVERVGVSENGGSLLERDAVLFQVAQGLPGVPREHITVYTLIRRGCKWGAMTGTRTGGGTA